MRKVLGLDLETTGLDCKRHGIIQIGMFIDIDGELVDMLLVNVQPFPNDILKTDSMSEFYYTKKQLIDELEMGDISLIPSGIKIKDLFTFDLAEVALAKITAFLDKHISKFDKTDKAYLMGFNLQFDMGFMAEWFSKLEFKYFGSYTNYRPLDAYHEACNLAFHGLLDTENLKLETLCRHFGIGIEAHNALSDILATRKLWYQMMEIEKC